MEKSRYSRNNSQSDLSDYASSTSSPVRIPDQIANPSHKQITCMQPHSWSEIHIVEKSQKFDRREIVYHGSVEILSAQTQYQKYSR